MASTDTSTSSTITAAAPEEHKRTVDEAFLNKLKMLVERLRLENATLRKSLDVERSEIRALKAQQESTLRNLKTEHKKQEEFLEKQLRCMKPEKEEQAYGNHKLIELKKLTTEIQSLKTANKGLQEKLKVAQGAECARAAELRAQAAKHEALEQAARRDARAQCRKLLEEIKSKERVIIQLRREVARTNSLQNDQTQRMECGAAELSRKLRTDQIKEKNNRDDLKTDIQHRKESFYREAPSDEDSAVSSAPASLSPQPLTDMWSCGQCRAVSERASVAARECTRLADALRDARDQLELMEFRLLELEDATPDKGARDNLTDSDSGCVSPGSRIKNSASPELKRMDSGYKSPHAPSSPCNPRRNLNTPQDDFKEDFAKAQVLAEILDRNLETSDSLKSNPVKDHLEQMILNAASVEDRNCLEQVLMLLYNLQALSSSVSEDECYQAKPKNISDLIKPKPETDIPSKTQKAIATVTPYQQKGYKCESLESLCSEERKPNSVLQESGIFEGVETESKCTQTDVNDSFECTGELNTEIQRLNSIREKLEKQGVRNRSLSSKEEGDGLECKCVKLGQKHKQYYERRLKFLEGKISIYEAAQDVKEAKLAERLQKEFLLENRIQELETQLVDLQDKYERLEEECCELEEIENDTRLHWQQLEMDYELCSAQLRDMTEQRECSRAQAERLMCQLNKRECALRARETELMTRLSQLERAVPALIAWNVFRVIGTDLSPTSKQVLRNRMSPLCEDTKMAIAKIKHVSEKSQHILNTKAECLKNKNVEEQIRKLLAERHEIETKAEHTKKTLEAKICKLQNELETAKRQVLATVCGCEAKKGEIDIKIDELERVTRKDPKNEHLPVDPATARKLDVLIAHEKELKQRVAELEKREAAYLEMLTQADDMWAEMEGGYKKKIQESKATEGHLKKKIQVLECEKSDWKKVLDPIKKKVKEIEESESAARVALEKAERDANVLKVENVSLRQMFEKSDAEAKKMENELKSLDNKFKELDHLRKIARLAEGELLTHKDSAKKAEKKFAGDLDTIRKELNRCYKQCQELDVTNSELKEEVESLEKQLTLTQKALNQCKRKCDEKIKTLSHELSIKTEELEELRSETMRQTYHASRNDLKPDRTEYVDEGYSIYTAVPKKTDYGRMHHSMSYISSDSGCSCPSMRSQLVSQLIEDLFERIHNTVDDDLTRLCKEITPVNCKEASAETKAKISNYLLMAISKELVRSIGDADAKTDTDDWQRAVSSMTYSVPGYTNEARGDFASLRLAGNAGVLHGATRLASVSCACAAARLCAAVPELADTVKSCQEEVLDHGDVKIMEEQLANAIESIVNCPSCALGTNSIVWSTDV
ncbi:axoneme-associated protein mst101(2) isoform X2 [Hyposmocoma kahamanoa]|uniref:axoneme-associated protein mst101(2) isoform X2 n=1 Tax=Hyposmocoma kahamanoa TaxID=1477025 RepID=UPI000E6D7DD2|nr:axoneme-associated protein mst101(2) isoform X2 [Hyposmocoma kahamanoa]